MSPIPDALRKRLRAAAPEPRCAYCQSPERLLGIPLEIDHIIPEAAGGKTVFNNLCLCCRVCNGHKSAQTHGRDPKTGRRVRLFNPRKQKWSAHFEWRESGRQIAGLTPTGRTTVETFAMNNDLIVNLRELWIALQMHPPKMTS